MKSIQFFLLTILSIALLQSCRYGEGNHTINQSNLFQLTIPDWVKEEKLGDDVVCSYANRYRNFYIVVVKANKDIPFDTFNTRSIHRIHAGLDSSVVSSTFKENAYFNEVYGKMGKEAEKIYYSQKVINGNKNYYQVAIWTRGLNRKLKYKPTIDTIMASFKEI